MSIQKGDPIKCRCPACGSRDLNLFEIFTVSDLYEIRDGKFEDRLSDSTPEPTGNVDGQCVQCKHRWRLRGNPIQATYMNTDPDNSGNP